jgi:hypothetical protein
MPSVLYVAMGITDNDLGPGWNNGYNWDTFSNAGNDPAAASAAAKELIRERLSYFKSSPGRCRYILLYQIQYAVE